MITLDKFIQNIDRVQKQGIFTIYQARNPADDRELRVLNFHWHRQVVH